MARHNLITLNKYFFALKYFYVFESAKWYLSTAYNLDTETQKIFKIMLRAAKIAVNETCKCLLHVLSKGMIWCHLPHIVGELDIKLRLFLLNKNLNFCITHNFKKDDIRIQSINLSFSLSLDSATMIQNCH